MDKSIRVGRRLLLEVRTLTGAVGFLKGREIYGGHGKVNLMIAGQRKCLRGSYVHAHVTIIRKENGEGEKGDRPVF